MSQKCYLLTSPEKFQQQHGNGSSNTDSHTPTGKTVAAILRSLDASSSWWEIPKLLVSPWEDSLENQPQTKNENGLSGETVPDMLNCWPWPTPPSQS